MARSLRFTFAVLVTLLPSLAFGSQAQLALILDASGSMWGQIEGENKIVIARRVLKDVLKTVPAETGVGLVAYGHREKADCNDIETVVPYGSTDRAQLTATIDALNPKGKTPITATLQKVFGELKGREDATTVVLVSDGLETCAGDPCKAVRDAKDSGIEFILHVVGFDLGKEEDVSQLECAALAGGGLYLTADNADELGNALEQAIEITPETPTGRLSVKTIAEGNLADAMLTVVDSASGEVVTQMRTYEHTETNPRVLPLPDGKYDVTVEAVRVSGRPTQKLEGIEIKTGEMVEKVVTFGTGFVRVKATRNGELSDVAVKVLEAGTRKNVSGGRTYRSSSSNPLEKEIVAGTYDVEIESLEIANKPTQRWEGIEIGGDKPVELEHDFASGSLAVGAKDGDTLIDAVASVLDAATGASVAGGRTYTSASSNPKVFVVSPGNYRVRVKPVKTDHPQREFDVTVEAGGRAEAQADWASGK